MAALQIETALNRFGYGAQPGQIKAHAGAPQEWLLDQIAPVSLKAHPWTSIHAIEQLIRFRDARKRMRQVDTTMSEQVVERMKVDPLREARREIRRGASSLTQQTLRSLIASPMGFQSRLFDFFSNHFSVSHQNIEMQGLAPTLEREAIAPNLNRPFDRMLIAVSQHPAMLRYLNNEQSAGENSRFAKRRTKRGLNENLAREILELHTLGVHGGYRQADVRELARAISGWSIGNPNRGELAGFRFRGPLHEPGARSVLGKRYAEAGVEQGEAILLDLARHPATAQHLSEKLARHFVADQPPPGLVAAMAARWRETQGHLGEVIATMVQHPKSHSDARSKYKSPRDFVFSSCRAMGVAEAPRGKTIESLALLGQAVFEAGSPAGYGDQEEDWDGAEALMARIEWSQALAARTRAEAGELAHNVLGAQLTQHTQTWLARAESATQARALLLMSPEFQYR